jgi:uncharacterized protein (DUF983 family)
MRLADVGLVYGRALRLRCPVCGQTRLFTSFFTMHDVCARCGHRYEREVGFFTGAMAVNLVLTEIIIFVIVLVAVFNNLPIWLSIGGGVALAALLPILGFPLSRSLWIATDLVLHPLDE